MNLRNNEQLKELVSTFAILNKDGIISTDDDYTTEDSEEDNISMPFVGGKLEVIYELPKINMNSSKENNSININLRVKNIEDEGDQFFERYATEYINFTDKNPTTYHVINYFKGILHEAGFTYFSESDPLEKLAETAKFTKGGLFYTIRSDLSLVAFAIGGKWSPELGVGVIGSHVDALTAKLKPNSTKQKIYGYNLLGVANYSGTLNKLWLDRDLGIGGTILVRDGEKVVRKLVSSSPCPIAKIPSLAEHFGEVAEEPYNKENQMVPIVGYGIDDSDATLEEKQAPLYERHSLSLLRYISEISQVPINDILELDLELFDVQSAVRGGISNEFIFAPRIDDRLCSYSAIIALIKYCKTIKSIEEYQGFNMVYLVDNEEIGSGTRSGAKGKFMISVIDKILALRSSSNKDVVFANSIILSADVTHALNPNFKDEYLAKHAPLPNKGLALKMDVNQHVATDSTGIYLMNKIAEKNDLSFQQFHIRNGARSGGTIGPIIATEVGARVIDVGLPQLSMHSIRAMCGYKEVGLGIKSFHAFFSDWRSTYNTIEY